MRHGVHPRAPLVVALLSASCSSAPASPTASGLTPGNSPRVVTPAPEPEVAEGPAASTPATDAVGATKGPILRMHEAMQIYSLIDIWSTEGGIELRVGIDSVGGSSGWYRFAALVDGTPDFSRETEPLHHANTAWLPSHTTESGNYIELFGARPQLFYHEVSGFRSAASDGYLALGADGSWQPFATTSAWGLGIGIEKWSDGRWLEWRAPHVTGEPTPRLPVLRRLGPGKGSAPIMPKPLEKRLIEAGFELSTFDIMPSGPVIAVGTLVSEEGFGTVVWEKPEAPSYFVTAASLPADAELTLLGGSDLATARLLAHDRVLRLEKGQWVEESKLSAEGMPDVWFGETLLRHHDGAAWARLAADAPWARLELHSDDDDVVRTFAVDDVGTIWMNEGEMLYASTAPTGGRQDVTEEMLVQGRQRSLLRGGSYDVTGEPPYAYGPKNCSAWYTVLVRVGQEMALDTPMARIAAALKGHDDLAVAKFSIVHERELRFFGASVPTWEMGDKLRKAVGKTFKVHGEILCARPPAVREVKIDLTSGKVSE